MNKQDYNRYIRLTAMAEHPELWSLDEAAADAVQWAAQILTERRVYDGTAPPEALPVVATDLPDDDT